jgi:hypothetical protein
MATTGFRRRMRKDELRTMRQAADKELSIAGTSGPGIKNDRRRREDLLRV